MYIGVAGIFENHNFIALNLSFKNVNNCRNTQIDCGSWLLEDRKLICDMEGKTVWLMNVCVPPFVCLLHNYFYAKFRIF